MALPQITGRVFNRELLTENLQIVRHESGFFPLTEGELFEAVAIIAADCPEHRASTRVQEAIKDQETRAYSERRFNNVGAALTHEYSRYYRTSGILLAQVELLQSEGARALHTTDAPLNRGARAIVQFASIADYQRGEETGHNPLRVKYRSTAPELQAYVAGKVKDTPVLRMESLIEETHAHLTARQTFWAESLRDIGDQIPELKPNVTYVFRSTPLVSARRKMVR